jgi:hypothetical protein
MLPIIYHLLLEGHPYEELGQSYFDVAGSWPPHSWPSRYVLNRSGLGRSEQVDDAMAIARGGR